MQDFVVDNITKLTDDQTFAYETITNDSAHQREGLFLLDAICGTGKTFLTNLFLASVQQNGEIAFAASLSGIAATLITANHRAHSAFKLPLRLDTTRSHDAPVSCRNKNSVSSKLLQACRHLVWMSAQCLSKMPLQLKSNTWQDIRRTNCVMGGVTFEMAGDF